MKASWMVGLSIWESFFDLWLRFVLVAGVAWPTWSASIPGRPGEKLVLEP
jgi:hypothetical protein